MKTYNALTRVEMVYVKPANKVYTILRNRSGKIVSAVETKTTKMAEA